LRRSIIVAASLWVLSLQAGPALAEVEGELASRTRSYLHTWSTNTRAALAEVPRIYAPRVNFYGRILDHGSLVREKAQFARRWPVRRYSLRPNTVRVRCDEQARRCLLRAVIDWRAESPARRARSGGSATFVQGFELTASRPLVIREGGAVLQQRRTPPRAKV
jgi:hypothetical protein